MSMKQWAMAAIAVLVIAAGLYCIMHIPGTNQYAALPQAHA